MKENTKERNKPIHNMSPTEHEALSKHNIAVLANCKMGDIIYVEDIPYSAGYRTRTFSLYYTTKALMLV